MKKFLFVFFCSTGFACDNNWIIIGAGPAGIITAGVLLDLGTPAKNICMIDPLFNVGDLSLYANIPANTKNKLWIDFLSSFKFIRNIQHPALDAIFNCTSLDTEYNLATIIEPLKVISDYIISNVSFVKDRITSLYFHDNNWRVGFSCGELVASHVVLATGGHPKRLDIQSPGTRQEISLVDALDKGKLVSLVTQTDTVAVFGSAHSAILILKNLSELNVREIVNFYNHPIKYTEDMGGWYLNISSGLKGVTADWAKNVLEKNPPKNLRRVFSSEENIKRELAHCTKVVYAIGFERNEIPFANNQFHYDDTTGVIASRLFGIGIAFPQKYVDPLGNTEHRVGINSFTEYALSIVPTWAKTKKNSEFARLLQQFDQLFDITIL